MKKLIVLLFIFMTLNQFGQSLEPALIAASGDFFASNDYSVSWSMGELAIETLVVANYILTQGFQQTRLTATGVEDRVSGEISFKVYPNPATDKLYILSDVPKESKYIIQIYDLLGSKLLEKNIENAGQVNIIDLDKLHTGSYMLIIRSEDNKISNTFLFQKVNE